MFYFFRFYLFFISFFFTPLGSGCSTPGIADNHSESDRISIGHRGGTGAIIVTSPSHPSYSSHPSHISPSSPFHDSTLDATVATNTLANRGVSSSFSTTSIPSISASDSTSNFLSALTASTHSAPVRPPTPDDRIPFVLPVETIDLTTSPSQSPDVSKPDGDNTIYDVMSRQFAELAETCIPASTTEENWVGLLNDVVGVDPYTKLPLFPTACYRCTRTEASSSVQCQCLMNARWEHLDANTVYPWVPIALEVDRQNATTPILRLGSSVPLSTVQLAVAGKRKDLKNVHPSTTTIRSKTCLSLIVNAVIMDLCLKTGAERDVWVSGLNDLLALAKDTGLI